MSTALLPPAERAFFRRLGVFSGPFDVRLAHDVAGEPGADRAASIDLLAALVERSLVAVETVGPITRYRLLELLRDHAHRELRETGELTGVEERFVDAMLAAADQIVARGAGAVGCRAADDGQWPVRQPRAGVRAVRANATPARSGPCACCCRCTPPLHEGRPDDVLAIGPRVLARWPDQPAPWRAEAVAVLASAAAIAGRDAEVEPLARTVVDDPTASPVAAAIADRAWGLAVRSTDPAAAARHFWLAAEAADAIGFSLAGMRAGGLRGRRARPGRGPGAGDRPARRRRRSGHRRRRPLRARARPPRAGQGAAAIRRRRARPDRARRGRRSGGGGARHVVVGGAGPHGGGRRGAWIGRVERSIDRWRAALDDAAGQGAVGEIAITLRAAATVAQHLGEHEVAAVLWSCAPRSTAITVLPELFPEAAGELRRTGPAPASDLVAALAIARATLAGTPPVERPPSEIVDGAGVARTGELVREGEAWRLGFAGRVTRSAT